MIYSGKTDTDPVDVEVLEHERYDKDGHEKAKYLVVAPDCCDDITIHKSKEHGNELVVEFYDVVGKHHIHVLSGD
jgi:hypothetical protein